MIVQISKSTGVDTENPKVYHLSGKYCILPIPVCQPNEPPDSFFMTMRVWDRETILPLPGVTITTVNGSYTTDADGFARDIEINLKTTESNPCYKNTDPDPMLIEFYHPDYYEREYNFENYPKQLTGSVSYALPLVQLQKPVNVFGMMLDPFTKLIIRCVDGITGDPSVTDRVSIGSEYYWTDSNGYTSKDGEIAGFYIKKNVQYTVSCSSASYDSYYKYYTATENGVVYLTIERYLHQTVYIRQYTKLTPTSSRVSRSETITFDGVQKTGNFISISNVLMGVEHTIITPYGGSNTRVYTATTRNVYIDYLAEWENIISDFTVPWFSWIQWDSGWEVEPFSSKLFSAKQYLPSADFSWDKFRISPDYGDASDPIFLYLSYKRISPPGTGIPVFDRYNTLLFPVIEINSYSSSDLMSSIGSNAGIYIKNGDESANLLNNLEFYISGSWVKKTFTYNTTLNISLYFWHFVIEKTITADYLMFSGEMSNLQCFDDNGVDLGQATVDTPFNNTGGVRYLGILSGSETGKITSIQQTTGDFTVSFS